MRPMTSLLMNPIYMGDITPQPYPFRGRFQKSWFYLPSVTTLWLVCLSDLAKHPVHNPSYHRTRKYSLTSSHTMVRIMRLISYWTVFLFLVRHER